ncbi:ribonuclease H-like domain-containing protein [Tanacetum coccineum]|uniref:Ribonuclease H-like domain-containing protein n=1 Tax=Tanacetum coccineum TaxID=301880 RepID=A0ABQ5FS92_9ASTR
MDDLYNNLKIYEAEVMRSSSISQNTQNVAFVSSNSTGSTNEAVKTAHGAFAANSNANASTLPNVDSLSDAVIYSFFASQSNSSELDNEDLKQIDPDDLEKMDLKWQMAMLTMKARRFLKKTERNLGVNGTDTISFDKTKMQGTQESRQQIQGAYQKNCASSSRSSSSDTEISTCSKACLKSYETLKEHYDNLTKDFNKSQLNVGAYKAGLESVEARLDVYKKNEAVFEEDIKILKLDIMLRDNALTELRKKFEKAEKERDDLKLTLEKFENSSKNLSKLLDSQICDKFKSGVGYDSQVFDSQIFDSQVNDRYKTGEGYHAVPPPYTGNFMPPKPDLVLADKDEYVFSESATSVPSAATSEVKTSVSKPKSVSEPLIEDWISDSENENETEFKSKQRKPSFAKVEFVKSNEHVKIPRESVEKVENNKQAKYPRKNSQSPRGNKRNWNNLMTQKLGSNFEFKNKACYVCGSFNHLIKDCDFYEKKMVEKPVWNNASRVNHQNSQRLTHPHPKGNFVPKEQHMTRNKSYLSDYEEIDGGFVAFGRDPKGGKITGKSKISDTGFKLEFGRCDTECVVLSPGFKLLDENHVLFRVPRKDNMYSVDLKNIVPSKGLHNQIRVQKGKLGIIEAVRPMLADIQIAKPLSGLKQLILLVMSKTRYKAYENAGKARVETVPGKDYILLPFLTQDPPFSSSSKNSPDAGFKPSREEEKKDAEHLENVVYSTVNTASIEDTVIGENIVYGCVDDPNMPNLEEIVYSDDDEDVDAEADMTNLDTHILVSPTPTTRIHKDHPLEQIIRDIHSAPQTRKNDKKLEPKKVIQALTDPSWIEAMQDELLQFKLQKVWTLVDLPYGKRAIGTKWIYRNKKDERVVRIKAIRLFLAYASFKDFVVYQMDVKSAFLYGKIEEKVYVCQPLRFRDPEFPGRVYKRGTIDKTLFIKRVKGDILLVQVYVDDIIFGSTKKGLHVVISNDDGIFINQDKYVDEILKKFGFSTVKTASTPMETSKPLLKDAEAEDVDVHLYISMIGSLMYLTSSRPDIMFVVCACARFQVTPKVLHLYAVKRIFRYLKGQPKLGLWYSKDSSFDLEAYTDSDYAGASLDRKSTTGGCQFLRRRLISWQCKKQTVVANSTTEA